MMPDIKVYEYPTVSRDLSESLSLGMLMTTGSDYYFFFNLGKCSMQFMPPGML